MNFFKMRKWEELPDEVLLNLLKCLSAKTDRNTFSLVCSNWNKKYKNMIMEKVTVRSVQDIRLL